MPAEDLRGRSFERILLIKLSAVGDVVHSFPAFNKLRRRYPKARIDWLATPAIAELLRCNPAIDNVVEFSRDEWSAVRSAPWRMAPLLGALRLLAALRAARYDLVLDLHGQMRSAVFAFASGAPVRIGFDKPRAELWRALPRIPDEARKHLWRGAREFSWLAYTHHIAVPTLDMHPVDRYLTVGALLGFDDAPPDFSFPIVAEATTRIEALLDYYGAAKSKFAALAPGTNWQTKAWRADGFAEVARHLQKKGFAAVLIGTEREREACEAVARLAPGTISLAGETTLPELAALIRRATICVTNDSGPLHLAAALGRPVVSIFGPTDPRWSGPYRDSGAVLRSELPCSPCYLRLLSRCTHDHACMVTLPAARVIERVDAILAKLPSRDKAAPQASRR